LESNIRYVIISKPKTKPKPNLTKTKTIKTESFGFGACLNNTIFASVSQTNRYVMKFYFL
jgi:hypothetical protein